MNSQLNLQDQTHQLFLQESLAALQQVQQSFENPFGDRHRSQLIDLGAQSVLTKASVNHTFLHQLKSTVAQGLSQRTFPGEIGIQLPRG